MSRSQVLYNLIRKLCNNIITLKREEFTLIHTNYFHLRPVSINNVYTCSMHLGTSMLPCVSACVHEFWRTGHMQIYIYIQVLLNLGLIKVVRTQWLYASTKNIILIYEKLYPKILILALVWTQKNYIIRRNMREDTSIKWNINLLSCSGVAHLD